MARDIYQRPLDKDLHTRIQEHNLQIRLKRVVQWHLHMNMTKKMGSDCTERINDVELRSIASNDFDKR
jgi:hypothetical protein